MLLIDTDMLVLLSATGLLHRVVPLLGFEMKDVRRLAAAPHQVRKNRKLRDQFGADALEAALPLIESIPVVEPASDLDLLDRLNHLMDAGEAQLFAMAAGRGDTLLVTGDKRAILGLAGSDEADCLESMQGRVVTLESVLWMLVKSVGAREVHTDLRIVASHKTLRVIFTEANVAVEDGCAAAIRSYFNSVDRESAGLLYNPDPGALGGV